MSVFPNRLFNIMAILLVGISVTFLLAYLFGKGTPAPKQPNIVLIFTDDQGYNDISLFGSDIPTPNMDMIAREGIQFNQAYVAAPICTPSRYALLTGQYPNRSQDQLLTALMFSQDDDAKKGIRSAEVTLAEALQDVGYKTAIIGKWHLGHGLPEFLPTRHGFDSFFGHTGGAVDYFTMKYGKIRDWYRDEELTDYTGYATDILADDAVDFVRKAKHDEKPFFLYLAFNAPHFGKAWDKEKQRAVNILQPDSKVRAQFSHIEDRTQREYAIMVVSLDIAIGRVLLALKESGQEKETIVIFMSDHGGDPKYGGSNAPFRDGKSSLYEGGIHVPAMIRWPGQIKAGIVSEQMISSLDLFPTLCKIANCAPDITLFDGIDLSPHLFKGEVIDRDLFWQQQATGTNPKWGPWSRETISAYRHKNWKYVGTRDEGDILFNLEIDPAETRNLAAEYPEILQDLKSKHQHILETFPNDKNTP